jgi:hypothetical protein
VTAFNRNNLDPNRREHFVYRAFDADDALLYVGCSMRPSIRYHEHRGQSKWFPLATRFSMQGPYNYDTARQLERDAIRTESPLWNHNEPKRFRLRALRQRISDRWFSLEHAIDGRPGDWSRAHHRSMEHLNHLLPNGVDDGRYVSQEEVDEAQRIESADRVIYNARVQHFNASKETAA